VRRIKALVLLLVPRGRACGWSARWRRSGRGTRRPPASWSTSSATRTIETSARPGSTTATTCSTTWTRSTTSCTALARSRRRTGMPFLAN